MSRKSSAWFLIVAALLLVPGPGRAVVEIQADAVTRLHAISGSDTGGSVHPDPTVGDPLANLRADGTFDRGIKAYGELYLGKKSAEDDSVELGSFYGSTGAYLRPIKVRFGRFEMPFGTQGDYRSDHARVQSNPLIGNPLVDPTDHQTGGEISGKHERLRWTLALTNGTDASDLSADRGFGSSLRISYELLPNVLEATLSGYRAYHGDTTSNPSSNSFSTENLFGPDEATNPASLKTLQSDVSTPLPHTESGIGLRPNVLTMGRDLNAWQADLKLQAGGLWRMRYGHLEDDLANLKLSGGSEETVEWSYWSVEGRYSLPGMGYLAGRWDRLDARTLEETVRLGRRIDENGQMDRFEVGWGRQLSNNLRVKLSYVNGRENLTGENFQFEGLSFEVSLTGHPKVSPKNLRLPEENISKPAGENE